MHSPSGTACPQASCGYIKQSTLVCIITYTYIHNYIYVYIYIYVCMYVCMYVYTMVTSYIKGAARCIFMHMHRCVHVHLLVYESYQASYSASMKTDI